MIQYFHSGNNNDGYWSSKHAKIQLEDVIDCLRELYKNTDFVFLFDQLSGHRKMRENGLSTNKMNVSYGGNVPSMRATVIQEIGE